MNRLTRILLFGLVPLAGVVSLWAPADGVHARQFRMLAPIASPGADVEALPDGAVPLAEPLPLSRSELEPMVRELIAQWNTPGMAATLSEQFFDKSRLLDVMDTAVPRDAKLRLQSIQGVQTLRQYVRPGTGDERGDLVSIVSVTVRTQLEFNGASGFSRLQGTNEFILEITQAAPP